MQDSQGQILALAFRQKTLKPLKLFPLGSEAERSTHKTYLTKSNHRLDSESQLPHKIIYSIFQLVKVQNKLTVLSMR